MEVLLLCSVISMVTSRGPDFFFFFFVVKSDALCYLSLELTEFESIMLICFTKVVVIVVSVAVPTAVLLIYLKCR